MPFEMVNSRCICSRNTKNLSPAFPTTTFQSFTLKRTILHHMKQLLLSLIGFTLLASQPLQAQQLPEFAPPGANWHESVILFGSPLFVTSFAIEVVALDTLKGVPCKKLNWLASGWFDSSYVYQDGLQIYTYDPVESHDWVLWLDFETEVDSSWTWVRTDAHYRDPFTNERGRVDTLEVTVIAKGDTTINGIRIPYMDVISSSTQRVNGESCSYGGSYELRVNDSTTITDTVSTRIIWALGPLRGSLYTYCGPIDVSGQYEVLGHNFRCYEDSTLGQITMFEHPRVVDCSTEYYPNGGVGTDPQTLTQLRLAPNPTSTSLRIETGPGLEGRPMDITLFDYAGKRVKNQRVDYWGESTTLNLSELKSGLYFVQLRSEGRLVASGKVVKQ